MGEASEGATGGLLRHTLATVAYRAEKAVRDAPPGFESFRAGATSRSAGEILAHRGDLFDWALRLADGRHVWDPKPPTSWAADVSRLFEAIAALDRRLADPPPGCNETVLFQGPIADALTHVGQINLLRRLAGSPVRAENYARATIAAGAVRPPFDGARSEF